MKTLIFLRTAPYNYKLTDKTLYESLDLIGKQSFQPHIEPVFATDRQAIRAFIAQHQPTHIFCSGLKRSHETASQFSPPQPAATTALNEIVFSMGDFSQPNDLTDEYLVPEKINRIRLSFSRALLEDRLVEKQASVMERLPSFKKTLDALPENSTVFCFSHGFVMKLYERLFESGDQVSLNDLVRGYDWSKPPYGFLDGFEVRLIDDKTIESVTPFRL